MASSYGRILAGVVFFIATCVVAVVGYTIAGWTLLDAIYMVTITVYGVGYGEVRTIEDPNLKVFTILIIIAGCTSAIYVFGGFVQLWIEGELNRLIGARRMSKQIDELHGHTIVCGFGRVGKILTRELTEQHVQFVVVDENDERCKEAELAGYLVVSGSATEENSLLAAGIHNARVLATVLPNDALNVFVTLTARDLEPEIEILARAENPATEKKLLNSGANKVVLPAAIGAGRIARLIARPSIDSMIEDDAQEEAINRELMKIGLEIQEFHVTAGSHLDGKTLDNLEANHLIVIGVKKGNDHFQQDPPLTTVLAEGDILVCVGRGEAISKIRTKAERSKPKMTYRGLSVQN